MDDVFGQDRDGIPNYDMTGDPILSPISGLQEKIR